MYESILLTHLIPGATMDDPPKLHPSVVTTLSVDEYQQMQMYLHAIWDGAWGTPLGWHRFLLLCAKAEEAYRYAGIPHVAAVNYTDDEELGLVMGSIQQDQFTAVFRDCLRTDVGGLKLRDRLAKLQARQEPPVVETVKHVREKKQVTEAQKALNRNAQERFRQKQRLEEYGPGAGTEAGIAAWGDYSAVYRAAQAELKEVRQRVYDTIRSAKAKYVRVITEENNRLQHLDK